MSPIESFLPAVRRLLVLASLSVLGWHGPCAFAQDGTRPDSPRIVLYQEGEYVVPLVLVDVPCRIEERERVPLQLAASFKQTADPDKVDPDKVTRSWLRHFGFSADGEGLRMTAVDYLSLGLCTSPEFSGDPPALSGYKRRASCDGKGPVFDAAHQIPKTVGATTEIYRQDGDFYVRKEFGPSVIYYRTRDLLTARALLTPGGEIGGRVDRSPPQLNGATIYCIPGDPRPDQESGETVVVHTATGDRAILNFSKPLNPTATTLGQAEETRRIVVPLRGALAAAESNASSAEDAEASAVLEPIFHRAARTLHSAFLGDPEVAKVQSLEVDESRFERLASVSLRIEKLSHEAYSRAEGGLGRRGFRVSTDFDRALTVLAAERPWLRFRMANAFQDRVLQEALRDQAPEIVTEWTDDGTVGVEQWPGPSRVLTSELLVSFDYADLRRGDQCIRRFPRVLRHAAGGLSFALVEDGPDGEPLYVQRHETTIADWSLFLDSEAGRSLLEAEKTEEGGEGPPAEEAAIASPPWSAIVTGSDRPKLAEYLVRTAVRSAQPASAVVNVLARAAEAPMTLVRPKDVQVYARWLNEKLDSPSLAEVSLLKEGEWRLAARPILGKIEEGGDLPWMGALGDSGPSPAGAEAPPGTEPDQSQYEITGLVGNVREIVVRETRGEGDPDTPATTYHKAGAAWNQPTPARVTRLPEIGVDEADYRTGFRLVLRPKL